MPHGSGWKTHQTNDGQLEAYSTIKKVPPESAGGRL